mgnify:CR=1 FL=1
MYSILSTAEAANLLMNDTFANWTPDGAFAMVEFLEFIEDEQTHRIEFNPVDIRCEWTEYRSAIEAWNDVCAPDDITNDEDEALQLLSDSTQVIEFDGGVIIHEF